MRNLTKQARDERGTAVVATLMFLMAMGVLSTALVFTVQNEMKSSAAYRYGQQSMNVANAGIQNAIQWFQNTYVPWVPATGYDLTTVPVQYSGDDVSLAGQSGYSSVYPNTSVTASYASSLGNVSLQASSSNTGIYAVNATLLKYRGARFIDPTTFATYNASIERWRLNSLGYWGSIARPLGISQITATIENSGNAMFDRALWGIDSVDLGGTMEIDSYDPALGLWDASTNSGSLGSIGSNGTVDVGGTAKVHGDMAYGPSASYNVGSNAQVSGNIIQLSEPRYFPPIPAFGVGTSDVNVNSNSSGSITPGSYRDITVKGTLTFGPGTYYIDELSVTAQGQIVISDTTTLYVKSALQMEGQGVANTSWDPSKLTVFYDGTSQMKMTGGSQAYIEVYAPRAEVQLNGNMDFFGSFIGKDVSITGGPKVHFSEGCLQQNLIPRPFRLITWSKDAN